MHDLSIKKIMQKTTIEISGEMVDKIYNKYWYEVKEKFVPPLFDEFVIKIVDKDATYSMIYQNFCETNKNFLFLPAEQKEKIVKDFMKREKLPKDKINCIYCKYDTATDWTLILVDNTVNKKVMNISLHYCADDEESKSKYNAELFFYDELDEKEITIKKKQALDSTLLLFLSICDYVQNYSQIVEYSQIDVEPVKKIEGRKKSYNKGYSQKIRLKSKRKKYVISTETERERKKYNKIKACWYVRGYYQHFGKEKVLKYIPPRINRRDKDKLNKPKNPTYEVKE